jgi:dUTP pyrophosphatase
MGVKLINNSDVDYVVQPGDRIAQLVCYPLVTPATAWSDEATSTDRGANGFGSTGK